VHKHYLWRHLLPPLQILYHNFITCSWDILWNEIIIFQCPMNISAVFYAVDYERPTVLFAVHRFLIKS
jgi:hypothetical protein